MDSKLLEEFEFIGNREDTTCVSLWHTPCDTELSYMVTNMSQATEFVMKHQCPSKPTIGAEHFG